MFLFAYLPLITTVYSRYTVTLYFNVESHLWYQYCVGRFYRVKPTAIELIQQYWFYSFFRYLNRQ